MTQNEYVAILREEAKGVTTIFLEAHVKAIQALTHQQFNAWFRSVKLRTEGRK